MPCSTMEDFAALRAMLLETEFSYDPDTPENTVAFWESIAFGGNKDHGTSSSFPLAFSVNLPQAKLCVTVASRNDFPAFSIASDYRTKQVNLSHRLISIAQLAAEEELPMLYVYSALQEAQQSLDEDDETIAMKKEASTIAASLDEARQSQQLHLKSALLWSHHLLATSKRKDIQHWSVELKVWAIAKLGYPGVMVFQGLKDDVDEFIRRIKALQWYALQIRYEEVTEVPLEGGDAAVLENCGLARACQPVPEQRQKPIAREVESMSDLASLMTIADLREAFAASMKLPS